MDDEVHMYNRIFWNTLYSKSGMPIELKHAGFNHLHENTWYTKFGYDPMELKFLFNLGHTHLIWR
jgi:hypothetical protein